MARVVQRLCCVSTSTRLFRMLEGANSFILRPLFRHGY